MGKEWYEREGGMEVRPALLIDFDGTIRYSVSGSKFIKNNADIALYEDVEIKLWEYRQKGYLILGVTNQGGVAFGIKTPLEEREEINTTLNLFKNDPFHAVKRCWHHPAGRIFPFNYRSLCRKPDIGMLVQHELTMYEAGYVIDWQNSLLVGDRPEDEECAQRAAIRFEYAWKFFGRTNPGLPLTFPAEG